MSNKLKTSFFLSMIVTMLLSVVASGQQKPITGYAPVNGLKMYYEIQGSGEPVVVLHGAFMAITTHVTLMDRMTTIVPMINDFLDAKPPKHWSTAKFRQPLRAQRAEITNKRELGDRHQGSLRSHCTEML